MCRLLSLIVVVVFACAHVVSCQTTSAPIPTDDVTFQQCIPFSSYSACVSGRIARCNTINMTLHITDSGFGFDRYYNLSQNAPVLDPPVRFNIPPTLLCSSGTVEITLDPGVWTLTPSYVQIQPHLKFDECGVRDSKSVLITAGADCSSATSCSSCAALTEPQLNTHPCGWCQATSTCSASNSQNQPYCVAGCESGGLMRTNDQCVAAAQGQSTSDSWTASKTATTVVLAVVIPIAVFFILLCLRRAYVRHRAKARFGTTSGVGSIQARTQGYRPTSDSVSTAGGPVAESTESSVNGSGPATSNADFRQIEGYNPPSTRPVASMDNV